MAYQTTQELMRDVLSRTGEPIDGSSEFQNPNVVLRYLNRAYYILQTGGGELDPTINIDWYWLRSAFPGAILMKKEIETTITIAANRTTITFPPLVDTGYALDDGHMQITGEPTIYRITVHAAGAGTATLLSSYVGDIGSKPGRLFRASYNLSADCLRIMAPMRTFLQNGWSQTSGMPSFQIHGIDYQRMEDEYPLAMIRPGVPQYFALLRETITGIERVRFNTSGPAATEPTIFIEYDFALRPTELIGVDGEEPRVPPEHRKLLADIAAAYIFVDKDDNRAAGTFEIAKQGLRAMAEDHRQRGLRLSKQVGRILPRTGRRTHSTRRGYVVYG